MLLRKFNFALAGCIALVAFMGMSGSALATHPPTIDVSCDLADPDAGDHIAGPYNNDAVVHDFKIKTPNSQQEHKVSGVEGSGLACGTVHQGLFVFGTYYDNIDVHNPPGVFVNNTSTMPNTGFVGTAKINVMNNALKLVQDQNGTIRIAPISECAAEAPVGGHIPGTIISCQRTTFDVGYNYNWTTDTDPGPGQDPWLTIGPAHTAGQSGPTHIKEFNLCGRVGAAGVGQGSYPADCGGNTAPYLQRNGDGSYPGCAGGKGVYTVTATMKNGFTTPAATTCVLWVGKSVHPPEPQ